MGFISHRTATNTCDKTYGWNDDGTTGCSKSCTIQYPDTFSFIEVPDPLSGTNPTYPLIEMAIPDIGEQFFDLHFATLLTRAAETDGIHGIHEYSRFDPFNTDQSMIILDPEESWNIYSTLSLPYNQPSNLVAHIDLEEPRWGPEDPNLIWGVDEFSIKTVNLSTGQTTVIKDFSRDPIMEPIIAHENVYRITMKDEGESSRDKR